MCKYLTSMSTAFLGLVVWTSMSFAGEPTFVKATGRGLSWDDATEDALREAVRRGGGTFIDSQTHVRDFELVSDTIYSRARGYVKSYSILNRRLEQGLYYVTIEARVAAGEIKDDWGGIVMLLERMGRPNLAVICSASEGVPCTAGQLDQLEAYVVEEFQEKHFDLVDAETLGEIIDREEARARLFDDTVLAGEISRKVGAQVLILARVTNIEGTQEELTPGLYCWIMNAGLAIKVVDSATAKVVAGIARHERGVSQNRGAAVFDALKSVLSQLMDVLLYRALYVWSEELDRGEKIYLDIVRTPYKSLSELKTELEKLEHVRLVVIQQAEEKGVSTIQILGRIRAETVADKIPEVSGGKLKVVGLEGNRIRVEPASRSGSQSKADGEAEGGYSRKGVAVSEATGSGKTAHSPSALLSSKLVPTAAALGLFVLAGGIGVARLRKRAR